MAFWSRLRSLSNEAQMQVAEWGKILAEILKAFLKGLDG